jgi:hypothetical protein
MTIVTTHYRYKHPPRTKRKQPAIEVPDVVTIRGKNRVAKASKLEPGSDIEAAIAKSVTLPDAAPANNDDRKSAIVTARRRPRANSSGNVPDMTPEEHRRRGDAADALFREMKRRIATKTRQG